MMKTKVYKGIVVNVNEDSISLLCKDGNFKNIPRPTNEVPKIGEKYAYEEKHGYAFRGVRYGALVSIILFTIIGYYVSATIQEEDAYLFAVDINPSIEIYTDKELHVTNIKYLNEDGKVVVDALPNKKQHIQVILSDVLNIAVEKSYLSASKEGMVSLTVVSINESPEINVEKTVRESLENQTVSPKVIINKGSKELMNASREANLSINKYQLYEELKKMNITINVDDLREKSIADIRSDVSRHSTDSNNDLQGKEHKKIDKSESEPPNSKKKHEEQVKDTKYKPQKEKQDKQQQAPYQGKDIEDDTEKDKPAKSQPSVDPIDRNQKQKNAKKEENNENKRLPNQGNNKGPKNEEEETEVSEPNEAKYTENTPLAKSDEKENAEQERKESVEQKGGSESRNTMKRD